MCRQSAEWCFKERLKGRIVTKVVDIVNKDIEKRCS